MRERFWERFDLQSLTHVEWEALCDGCGLCCLVKLEDEDTGKFHYTDVSCQLLDCSTGHCSNYANRKDYVSGCIQLTYDMLSDFDWLPTSCTYRLMYENKPLPSWHPLLTQDATSVRTSGVSAAGRCISELEVAEDDLEDRLVKWVVN